MAGVVLLTPPAVLADEGAGLAGGRKKFDQQFGRELKAVQRSEDIGDDLALSKTLLIAARMNRDDPAFLAVICRQAYELAARSPEGYSTAIDAMELQASSVASDDQAGKLACLEKILLLRLKVYTAATGREKIDAGEQAIQTLMALADCSALVGDSYAADLYLRRATSMAESIRSDVAQLVKEQFDSLKSRLALGSELQQARQAIQADPTDTSARAKLINLYLMGLDDRASAAKFLSPGLDETWRSYVPMTLRSGAAWPTEVLGELASWYYGLVKNSPMAPCPQALRRAESYLVNFIASAGEKAKRNPAQAKAQTRAQIQLRDIRARLAKLHGPDVETLWSLNSAALNISADGRIAQALVRAQKYLLNMQRADGSWPEYDWFETGARPNWPTALITFALIKSGLPIDDDRLTLALELMASRKTDDTLTLAFRCFVWSACYRPLRGKFSRQLRADAVQLFRSSADGSFQAQADPAKPGRNGDPLVTMYATVALGRADQAGVKVPNAFWIRSLAWWRKGQNSDGGWGYEPGDKSRHVPTVAGAVCMLTSLAELGRTRPVALENQALASAVEWIDEHFDNQKNRDPLHYLYGLALLGTARGTTIFRDVDWFKWASDDLLKRQGDAGQWNPHNRPAHTSTALGLLLLSLPQAD